MEGKNGRKRFLVTPNQKAGVLGLLSVVALNLTMIFKSLAIVFYGLGFILLVIALAIAIRYQYQQDPKRLRWLIPLGFVCMVLSMTVMYLIFRNL